MTASGKTIAQKYAKSPCKGICIFKCNSSFYNEERNPAIERSQNIAYYLIKNGNNVRVYRKVFIATLDISNALLRNAFKKNTSKRFLDGEMRGKHG
ncbi:hypothetical protein PR048_011423 [Dryococelus australis]|uniref:Uncharacterized protein n=1 Tax=Dryococelus australis TaxID=614101 RepID=A0ABQ9HLK7_9NEOP|nr:hypothetical protein PR048_011423 [Dryococelus australis]